MPQLQATDLRVRLATKRGLADAVRGVSFALVPRITADLGGSPDLDLTTAQALHENLGVAFQGPVKVGSFDVLGALARQWLALQNPNGLSNAAVLCPWANGQDIARRASDTWIVDFGATMGEAPVVKPMHEAGMRASRTQRWWLHGETVPGLRRRCAALQRYIATPRVAKQRYFVWLPVQVWPDSRRYAIARDPMPSEHDMTVAELMEHLRLLPSHMPVLVEAYETAWDSVNSVRIVAVENVPNANEWDGEFREASESGRVGRTVLVPLGRRGQRR